MSVYVEWLSPWIVITCQRISASGLSLPANEWQVTPPALACWTSRCSKPHHRARDSSLLQDRLLQWNHLIAKPISVVFLESNYFRLRVCQQCQGSLLVVPEADSHSPSYPWWVVLLLNYRGASYRRKALKMAW